MKINIIIFVICFCRNVRSDQESIQRYCGIVSDNGDCDEYKMQYFYHPEFGTCSPFWYSGCGGNKNRFETFTECESTCINPHGKAVCDLPKVRGPCTENHMKFYYDIDKKKCLQFSYGGCKGNANKFDKINDCRQVCMKNDESESEITHGAGSDDVKSKNNLNIPDNCTDNSQFASCSDVIRRGHCRHPYYAKFCCRSCALDKLVR
ncbi:hypothetical protein PVAND_016462 [Polypedilum vanderplanki]|uniref:Uncharacterized protein n=1 Tax=Polypedilum vanderplanki TaxID=319348 RepID=A0A9J6BG97_POLVA|nr:hypothetical protein PVAND_016462 [Polypedilum vanderplanki]